MPFPAAASKAKLLVWDESGWCLASTQLLRYQGVVGSCATTAFRVALVNDTPR